MIANRERGWPWFSSQSPSLVRDPPVVEPLHVLVLLVRAHHSPADRHEEDVKPNNRQVQETIGNALGKLVPGSEEPIGKETKRENGEVERRVVVMDVGDTAHDDEGQIVEEPADDRVDSSVVDLVDVVLGELVVATLPAESVPDEEKTKDAETGSRSPVDERITKQEVLDDLIIPAAHSQTNMEDRPLPPLGSQIVLLVRIGNKSVVGGHHGNVLPCMLERVQQANGDRDTYQVDEVLEERVLVLAGLGRRHWFLLAKGSKPPSSTVQTYAWR